VATTPVTLIMDLQLISELPD